MVSSRPSRCSDNWATNGQPNYRGFPHSPYHTHDHETRQCSYVLYQKARDVLKEEKTGIAVVGHADALIPAHQMFVSGLNHPLPQNIEPCEWFPAAYQKGCSVFVTPFHSFHINDSEDNIQPASIRYGDLIWVHLVKPTPGKPAPELIPYIVMATFVDVNTEETKKLSKKYVNPDTRTLFDHWNEETLHDWQALVVLSRSIIPPCRPSDLVGTMAAGLRHMRHVSLASDCP